MIIEHNFFGCWFWRTAKSFHVLGYFCRTKFDFFRGCQDSFLKVGAGTKVVRVQVTNKTPFIWQSLGMDIVILRLDLYIYPRIAISDVTMSFMSFMSIKHEQIFDLQDEGGGLAVQSINHSEVDYD